MPSIKVSYFDLEEAFIFSGSDQHYWLDKQTGRVLAYGSEAAEAAEGDDVSDLPEWMKDEVSAAREVLRALGELPDQGSESKASGQRSEADPLLGIEARAEAGNQINSAAESNRYVRIEQIPSNQAYEFMSAFADEIADSRIRDMLQYALRSNLPIRRFKESLSRFPNERERWYQYESRRRRGYIELWAREEEVEIDFSTDVS